MRSYLWWVFIEIAHPSHPQYLPIAHHVMDTWGLCWHKNQVRMRSLKIDKMRLMLHCEQITPLTTSVEASLAVFSHLNFITEAFHLDTSLWGFVHRFHKGHAAQQVALGEMIIQRWDVINVCEGSLWGLRGLQRVLKTVHPYNECICYGSKIGRASCRERV